MSDQRGYLWQDLAGEIVEEFGALGAVERMGPIERARRGFCVIQTSADKPELEPQTGALKNRRHYARAVASGQCVKCPGRARDGKKTCQSCSDKASERSKLRRRGMRERLPELRAGVTHHFAILAKCNKLKCVAGKVEGRDGLYDCPRCGGSGTREIDGYLTCNTYEDGRLGEIFIRLGKVGAEEAIYEQWAIAVSTALQFGVPVDAYFRKFVATQFEPSGATRNKEIARCTSVLDYIAKYVLLKYGEKAEQTQTEVST